jgi:phosphopantothenate---cysteine ligase (ATP)
VSEYQLYKAKLLTVEYVTLTQYFDKLESISRALNDKKDDIKSLTYLSAAVSDYYLPDSAMPEHKIQSADGKLTMTFDPSPKKLGLIKSEWNPATLAVSFKLETDLEILEQKALKAIENYKVDAVIANEL